MREEEKEHVRNEHDNGGDQETKTSTKRMIRIMVDPKDEEIANGENNETGASSNSEPQPLASWLVQAISDSTDMAIEKKAAVVTPESRSMNHDDEIGIGDENKDELTNVAEWNDEQCNPIDFKKKPDHPKPMTIEWSPLLLKLISTIRRRANRKRIANEAMVQPFYIKTNDTPSRFLNSFSRRILLRAMEDCWIQTFWRAGWNRLKEVSWMTRQALSQGIVESERSDKDVSPFSFFIRHRRGNFTSSSMRSQRTQCIPKSRVLVVYRGDSGCGGSQSSPTKRNDSTWQQQLVLVKETMHPTLKKIWETAILAAAALCVYQKQQEQQKDRKQIKGSVTDEFQEIARCSKTLKRRVAFFSTIQEAEKHPDHGSNDTAKRKEESSIIPNTDRCNVDSDYAHNQDGDSNLTQNLAQPLLKSGKENVSNLEVDKSETFTGMNGKRRSQSRWQQNRDNFDSLWKKPRKIGKGRDTHIYELSSEDSEYLYPSTHCNSIRSRKRCSKRELESWKREAFFLSQRIDRRFGPNAKKKQCTGSLSTDSVQNGHDMTDNANSSAHGRKVSIVDTSMLQNTRDDEESNDSEKCLFGAKESDEDLAYKTVDYSSPIEFPICNDDYSDDEEEEPFTDNINDFSAEFEASEGPTPLPATNDKPSCPQSLNKMKSGTNTGVDIQNIAQVKLEKEPGEYDVKKKKKRMGKRRKRTTEDKPSRKREKKRKRASKQMGNKDEAEKESLECTNENRNGNENDSDQLETPRKLEFRDFSPVKIAIKDQSRKIQSARFIQSPNSVPVIQNENYDSKDKDSESSPLKAKRIVPIGKDPFLISPDEIPETINTSYSSNQHHQKGNQHMNDGEKKATDNAPISVLCSEAFFENFEDLIAEIVQENPTNRKPIRFIDTSLVDLCSVDIETPSRGAILVSTLSQIQKSGGIMSHFLPKVIELVVTNRYDSLSVFVCVDLELDYASSREIVNLQTSFLSCERGMPRTKTSVQLCSKQSLPRSILIAISHSVELQHSNSTGKVERWLSDARACHRLKFLISIIPTLSVTGALQWLELSTGISQFSMSQPNRDEDRTAKWFQQCFCDVQRESSRLESHFRLSNSCIYMMSTTVPRQLVLTVKIRFDKN